MLGFLPQFMFVATPVFRAQLSQIWRVNVMKCFFAVVLKKEGPVISVFNDR